MFSKIAKYFFSSNIQAIIGFIIAFKTRSIKFCLLKTESACQLLHRQLQRTGVRHAAYATVCRGSNSCL